MSPVASVAGGGLHAFTVHRRCVGGLRLLSAACLHSASSGKYWSPAALALEFAAVHMHVPLHSE